MYTFALNSQMYSIFILSSCCSKAITATTYHVATQGKVFYPFNPHDRPRCVNIIIMMM